MKLTEENLVDIEKEVTSLIKWCEDNMGYSTIKVKPRTQMGLLELMIALINDKRETNKALKQISELSGNIRPDGEAWEYVGEFNEAVKIARKALGKEE